jgi:hypothetical protein
VKLSCGDTAVNFFDDQFRLDANGTKISPQPTLSDHYTPAHSEYAEKIKFIISQTATNVALIVGKVGSSRTAKIGLNLNSTPLSKN